MMEEDSSPAGLENVVAALRQPVMVRPDLVGRARHRQRRQRLTRGVVTLGVLAMATVGVAVTRQRGAAQGVTFTLDAPKSRSVTLVGDFTDWRTDRVHLTPTASGEWRVALKLPPGRYRFSYLVDNVEWRADSRAARTTDDFGRPTSIIAVTAQ